MTSRSPYKKNKKNKKRHYTGHNPFVDNDQNNARFDKTLQECDQLGGVTRSMNGMKLASSSSHQHQTRVRNENNPYIDPNLFTHPSQNEQYIQQHSVHKNNHNGYTHHRNGQNDEYYHHKQQQQQQQQRSHAKEYESNYNNWNDAESSNHESENEKIVITQDNPYHPRNFYKNGDRRSDEYVDQFRSSPKRAKKSRREYDANVNDDFAQWAYDEFLNNLHNDMVHEEEAQDEEEEEKEEPQNGHSKKKLAIDDSLDGQQMINSSTFQTLQANDTVFIRNDIGDWEIFRCKVIEPQGSTFVGTFSDGFKEKSIWAEQLNNGIVMAKYAKVDEEQINRQMDYKINSFIKIILENNREVLCVLKELSGSIAGIKDVKTGKLIKIDLNKTKHRML